ncbi:uncharacterized protein TNCV_4447831 [Trichonephila clavipes]|nr:uncharacterized protein TNCV_4447831 [Trichonephila clavipes]
MPQARNQRQYEQLSDFEMRRVVGIREASGSVRRISYHLSRSDMIVAQCWQQFITEGIMYRRGGSRRPRNINANDDHAIIRAAPFSRTTSLELVRRNLPPSKHPVASKKTIRQRRSQRATGRLTYLPSSLINCYHVKDVPVALYRLRDGCFAVANLSLLARSLSRRCRPFALFRSMDHCSCLCELFPHFLQSQGSNSRQPASSLPTIRFLVALSIQCRLAI